MAQKIKVTFTGAVVLTAPRVCRIRFLLTHLFGFIFRTKATLL